MEAVAADVWNRMVRLLKDPAGLGAGLAALRETKCFLKDLEAGTTARIGLIHEETAIALEPWADPADASEEAQALRQDQASHLNALASEEELANDRLEYVEFQIRVVNNVFWNVVGHGVIASWEELSPEARAGALGATEAERPVGTQAKHAALIVWVVDNAEGGPGAITAPNALVRAVNRKLNKMYPPRGEARGPSGGSLWTMVCKEAATRFKDEWPSGKTENDFAKRVAAIRRLAALYEGLREDDGAPVYPGAHPGAGASPSG